MSCARGRLYNWWCLSNLPLPVVQYGRYLKVDVGTCTKLAIGFLSFSQMYQGSEMLAAQSIVPNAEEFRCYEVKIEESEEAGSHGESNHVWLEPPVLFHRATTAGQRPTLTILYMYCTSGME